jgi:glycosyltransferase involved in cell wall biosynthesis
VFWSGAWRASRRALVARDRGRRSRRPRSRPGERRRHADRHVVIRSESKSRPTAISPRDAARHARWPESLTTPLWRFVGRLDPAQGAVRMLARLRVAGRGACDAHLVLVGDGAQRSEVEARVRAAGLDSRVHLLGLRRDVPVLLRAFDCAGAALAVGRATARAPPGDGGPSAGGGVPGERGGRGSPRRRDRLAVEPG